MRFPESPGLLVFYVVFAAMLLLITTLNPVLIVLALLGGIILWSGLRLAAFLLRALR